MADDTAKLFRMVMPDHTCPYGLKAKHLLESKGIPFEDVALKTREETDVFKAKHNVKTTPQIWLDGKRVGGYDDLLRHFGKAVSRQDDVSYQPVIAIFAMSALMAMALGVAIYGSLFSVRVAEWFVAIALCFLAAQKLQDVEKFSTMFLNYDLLAKRWVPYGKIYPFAEALSGVLMLTGSFIWLSAPIMLIIGGIGAYSVFKAVYIEKRELKCACVGGSSNVPLGFVSLTENLIMVLMGLWMLTKLA